MSLDFALQLSMNKFKIHIKAFSIPSLLLCLSFGLPSDVFAAPKCQNVFAKVNDEVSADKDNLNGAYFLHQRQPELHRSGPVAWTVQNLNKSTGQVLMKPNVKIDAWLKALERIQEQQQDPAVLQRVKDSYYRNHVVEFEKIPENYYLNQQQIARNLGHKTTKLTKEVKQKMAEMLILDQKQSLNQWIEYFYSKDSIHYPLWLKYWMFDGMLKLGKFDPETGKFRSRSDDTVSPFADLNREALAIVADAVVKKVNGVSFAQ